jgi:hypothetical protein
MGNMHAESGHRTDDAFMPDRGDLDRPAVFQNRQQGKYAAVGKVHIPGFFTGLDENGPLLKLFDDHVRRKQAELIVRQGVQ